jgi:hypothetical protein
MANRKQIEEAIYFIDAQEKEEITIGSSASTLTSAVYGTLTRALIQAQDANVRFWTTGDTPTTSSGYILYKGDFLELNSTAELANLKR